MQYREDRERERDVPNKFNIVKSNGETHNSHVRKRANAKKNVELENRKLTWIRFNKDVYE